MKRIRIALIFGSVAVTLLSGCTWHMRSKRRPRHLSEKDSYVELPIKGIKDTTLEEAMLCKNYYKKIEDYDLVSKYLEHALTLAKDHMLRSKLILELGDIYMKLEDKDKAEKMYNQYKLLYPGSPQINYVLYQEIVASYEDAGESTKDATKNKNTVKLAESYLKEFSNDEEHSERVKKMLEDSYFKLFKKEIDTADFYVKKYSYDPNERVLISAKKRIQKALKEYASHVPNNEELLKLKTIEIPTEPTEAFLESLTSMMTKLNAYIGQHYIPSRHGKERIFASSVSLDESYESLSN
jgi:outer membrane protein assembly factor BamD (BamD/ComL family)